MLERYKGRDRLCTKSRAVLDLGVESVERREVLHAGFGRYQGENRINFLYYKLSKAPANKNA